MKPHYYFRPSEKALRINYLMVLNLKRIFKLNGTSLIWNKNNSFKHSPKALGSRYQKQLEHDIDLKSRTNLIWLFLEQKNFCY